MSGLQYQKLEKPIITFTEISAYIRDTKRNDVPKHAPKSNSHAAIRHNYSELYETSNPGPDVPMNNNQRPHISHIVCLGPYYTVRLSRTALLSVWGFVVG